MYNVEVTRTALPRLERFDAEVRRRFVRKIEKLKNNPRLGKPLHGGMAGTWELYFEHSFRILYTIDEASKTVYVKFVLHKDELARLRFF